MFDYKAAAEIDDDSLSRDVNSVQNANKTEEPKILNQPAAKTSDKFGPTTASPKKTKTYKSSTNSPLRASHDIGKNETKTAEKPARSFVGMRASLGVSLGARNMAFETKIKEID